jgi:hypothetical protein
MWVGVSTPALRLKRPLRKRDGEKAVRVIPTMMFIK